jgi:hypothetical protein
MAGGEGAAGAATLMATGVAFTVALVVFAARENV